MAHYKPYKMKGHALPGINQKSETENLPDGRSASSPFQNRVTSLEGMDEGQVASANAHNDAHAAGKDPHGTKESPNKWVQFIPMALSAMSSMKKDKK